MQKEFFMTDDAAESKHLEERKACLQKELHDVNRRLLEKQRGGDYLPLSNDREDSDQIFILRDKSGRYHLSHTRELKRTVTYPLSTNLLLNALSHIKEINPNGF